MLSIQTFLMHVLRLPDYNKRQICSHFFVMKMSILRHITKNLFLYKKLCNDHFNCHMYSTSHPLHILFRWKIDFLTFFKFGDITKLEKFHQFFFCILKLFLCAFQLSLIIMRTQIFLLIFLMKMSTLSQISKKKLQKTV